MMIILGIDPGSQVTGWGLIEKANGSIKYIASGTLKTLATLPFSERLRKIYEGLQDIIDTYEPGVGVVEDLFFANNARSALKLGQARGIALLALAQRKIPCAEYTPLAVKQALVGYGRASKDQVAAMVARLLKVEGQASADATDALAVAICHAHSETMRRVAS